MPKPVIDIYAFALLLAVVLATGCVSPVQPDFDSVQDSGPDRDIDIADIVDAVPRYEPITLAGNQSPYTVLGKTYHINFDTRDFRETGYASWYGKKFHGRKTSNGETYDMFAMSAAHKTLPIPCYVRVTNLENRRQVVVRVNDRGPFHDGRIIDLSYAAAKKLDFHRQGTARVQVEVIAQSTSLNVASAGTDAASGGRSFLQVGAYRQRSGADAMRIKLTNFTDYAVQVQPVPERNLYRVLIGPIADNYELMYLRQKLLDAKVAKPHVVKLN